MRAFLRNASLRPSCLECPFKRRSGSDVTLGDYWGVQAQHPGVPVEGGVSAVVCNTRRGADAMADVSGLVDSGATSFDKIVSGNVALVSPVQPHAERDAFMSALADGMTVPDMMARWGFEPTLVQKLILRVKGAAKKLIRGLVARR